MANEPKGRGPRGGGRGVPRGGFQRPKDTGKTVRRLLRYIGTHPLYLILAIFFVIAAALASVAATYTMRPIINSIAAAVSPPTPCSMI